MLPSMPPQHIHTHTRTHWCGQKWIPLRFVCCANVLMQRRHNQGDERSGGLSCWCNNKFTSYEINKMIKTIKSIIFNGRFNQFAKLHHFRYRCEPLYIVISFYLLWINNKHWWAMLKLQHKRAIHIQREVNNYCK